jgi:hypothetical protein
MTSRILLTPAQLTKTLLEELGDYSAKGFDEVIEYVSRVPTIKSLGGVSVVALDLDPIAVSYLYGFALMHVHNLLGYVMQTFSTSKTNDTNHLTKGDLSTLYPCLQLSEKDLPHLSHLGMMYLTDKTGGSYVPLLSNNYEFIKICLMDQVKGNLTDFKKATIH